MKIVHTVAIRGSGLHSVPYLEGKKEIPIMTTRSARIFLPLLFTSVLCAQLAGAQTLNQSTPSWWNKYQHLLKNRAESGGGATSSLSVGANVDVSNECGPQS